MLPGDTIVIISTARKISAEELQPALEWLKNSGWTVELSPYLFEVDHQFAGNDETRQRSLQWALDHPTAKAIWCARGGYGTVRILDGLDWSAFAQNPKWITGYSDVTALHGEAQRRGFATIHGTMPINVPSNSAEALNALQSAWHGKPIAFETAPHSLNIAGNAKGVLVGGNLSVLYSITGSSSEPPLENVLLFMEDLDEYLYHIDRMMMNLSRNGWWTKISGLVIGGMTDMNDNTVPFGESAEEIIARHLGGFDIPVLFGLPAGHLDDNRALVFGKEYDLKVSETGGTLSPL